MEDFILREIGKIGHLLRSLLHRLGLRRTAEGPSDELVETTKSELIERLDIDIDTLLRDERFVERLVAEYGFGEEELEAFAELLADLAAAAETHDEQCRLAAAACTVYKHQEAHGAPASINRYYVLKELARYNP